MRGAGLALAIVMIVAALPDALGQGPVSPDVTIAATSHVGRSMGFTVAGKVTLQGVGLAHMQVRIFVNGAQSVAGATNTAGNYALTVVSPATAQDILVDAHVLTGSALTEGRSPAILVHVVPPPSAPRDLVAVVPNVSVSTIALTWAAPSESYGAPINSYSIYRSVDGGLFTRLVTIPVALQYADASPVMGSTYRYYVTAATVGGSSVATATVQASTADIILDLEVGVLRVQACVTEPTDCVWASPGDVIRYSPDVIRFNPQFRVGTFDQEHRALAGRTVQVSADAYWDTGSGTPLDRTVVTPSTGIVDVFVPNMASWSDLAVDDCRTIQFDITASTPGGLSFAFGDWNVCRDF